MHQQPRATEQPFALNICSRSPQRSAVSGRQTIFGKALAGTADRFNPNAG